MKDLQKVAQTTALTLPSHTPMTFQKGAGMHSEPLEWGALNAYRPLSQELISRNSRLNPLLLRKVVQSCILPCLTVRPVHCLSLHLLHFYQCMLPLQ